MRVIELFKLVMMNTTPIVAKPGVHQYPPPLLLVFPLVIEEKVSTTSLTQVNSYQSLHYIRSVVFIIICMRTEELASNMTISSYGGLDDQSCDINSVDNFRTEYDLCKRKIAVIMEQRLPVSVQEFADLFVEDRANFSYKM